MAKGRFVCHLFKGENIQTYYTRGGIVLKTLIVYASIRHGNTEKIGKEIARSLNANIINIKEVSL